MLCADFRLFNLYGSGIMDYLHRKYLSRRIPHTTAPRFSGVACWNHIAGIVIFYLIAVTVSITILLTEILVYKQDERRKDQKKHEMLQYLNSSNVKYK